MTITITSGEDFTEHAVFTFREAVTKSNDHQNPRSDKQAWRVSKSNFGNQLTGEGEAYAWSHRCQSVSVSKKVENQSCCHKRCKHAC